MKHRIISLIMIMILAFASTGANANALDENLDIVADKLLEFSSQDRENLMTIVYPFIAVDSGIDILVSMIKNHSETSDTMIDGYISQILKYTTKEDMIFILNSFKIIPEGVRQEYFSAYMNKEEIALTDESNEYMTEFLKILYTKSPALKTLFESDGVTNGTVAKLFKFIPAANDGMPIISVNSQYEFAPYYISSTVADKWDILCKDRKEKSTVSQYVKGLTQHLNNEYPQQLRTKISVLFEELGICYIPTNNADGFKNVNLNKGDKVSYPVIYAYFEGGKMMYKTQMIDKDISVAYFSDCDGWYKPCVTELAYMGIVAGRGNGLFCPNDFVTREEFVKMICAAINLPDADAQIPFADVDNNAWYCKYIKSAYNYGIVNGQSVDSFGVGKNISRQDAAVICNNILKNMNIDISDSKTFADGGSISDYAVQSVKALSSIGIINGDDKGNFNPVSNITRAESAKIINELIYFIVNR